MDLNLRNKFALVTGGTHGIGRAVAMGLADEGCNVAICARNKDRMGKTVSELKAKGVDSIGISADVMIKSDIENVMKTVIARWGTIHILINNVGGGGRWGSEIVEETKEDVWLANPEFYTAEERNQKISWKNFLQVWFDFDGEYIAKPEDVAARWWLVVLGSKSS